MTSDDIQSPPDGEGRRTALDEVLLAEFRQRILDTGEWLRLTLVRHQGSGAKRESLRPLLIRNAVCWQAERVEAGRPTVRNLTTREARSPRRSNGCCRPRDRANTICNPPPATCMSA